MLSNKMHGWPFQRLTPGSLVIGEPDLTAAKISGNVQNFLRVHSTEGYFVIKDITVVTVISCDSIR